MNSDEMAGSECSSCGPVSRTSVPPCTCPTCGEQPKEDTAATSVLTFSDHFDHFLARVGVNRMGHIVPPGLYRLGDTTPDSPVFVSANYTLSFDALRTSLAGVNGYILVLDTKGVNVWCAAGKGTFGTDELVRMIALTRLASVVSHRTLILPQLSAPGISAHEVARRSGFRVKYGPVRAGDLPAYLKTRKATREMRTVRFPLYDRIILAPVELAHVALPCIAAAVVLWLLAGPLAAFAAITAVLAGTVLFPALLPYIPGRDLSLKGFILGFLCAIPFALAFVMNPALAAWAGVTAAIIAFLLIPATTAYLALNFTGCTTFTSRTGVKWEIFRYVPAMAVMGGTGVVLMLLLGVSRLAGWI
jgi:hypothetical protein